MKYKCRKCGYVGPPAYPPPKLTRDGSESQVIPACPKCKSGVTRME